MLFPYLSDLSHPVFKTGYTLNLMGCCTHLTPPYYTLAFWDKLIPIMLYMAFVLVAVFFRIMLHYRTNNDAGLRIVQMRAFDTALAPNGVRAFYAGLSLILGFMMTFGATLLDAFYPLVISPLLEGITGKTVAVLLSLSGLVIIITAQLQMGNSWRVGVDPHEKTTLITHGLFQVVRNPIYSGVILFVLGLLILLPHPIMFVGSSIGWIGIQMQVRYVEEPQMIKYHHTDYLHYARQVGRFMPFIGRLSV